MREERAGLVAAVAVVVVRDSSRASGDAVLCLRRAAHADAAPGVWETVSGRIEGSEDPLEAARREVVEETKLAVVVNERPVDAYFARRGERPMIVIVYRADLRSGEVERSEEHDAHAWLARSELEGRGVPARLVVAIDAALRAGVGV